MGEFSIGKKLSLKIPRHCRLAAIRRRVIVFTEVLKHFCKVGYILSFEEPKKNEV
jgi:hypothetical protein